VFFLTVLCKCPSENIIFLCVSRARQKNKLFSVSGQLQLCRDDNDRKIIFLAGFYFFLCGFTHTKNIFNLGCHIFLWVYYAQKNIFLTVNTQKISIFLTSYFCVYFSERSPLEKYFSDGIRIFLCVFACTEECEFPAVYPLKHVSDWSTRPVLAGTASGQPGWKRSDC
jgi:hypothetical protein